jgi:hypothetical protein
MYFAEAPILPHKQFFLHHHFMQDEEKFRRIIKETVCETLSALGLHSSDPAALQADMIYLRKVRKGSEEISAKVRISLITILLSSLVYLLWDSFKAIFKSQ